MPRVVWPKVVPILKAEDMHKRNYSSSDGCKHCLLGWLRLITDRKATRERIADELKITIRAMRSVPEALRNRRIPAVNDSNLVTKEMLAKIWNTTMRRLGYTQRTTVDPEKYVLYQPTPVAKPVVGYCAFGNCGGYPGW